MNDKYYMEEISQDWSVHKSHEVENLTFHNHNLNNPKDISNDKISLDSYYQCKNLIFFYFATTILTSCRVQIVMTKCRAEHFPIIPCPTAVFWRLTRIPSRIQAHEARLQEKIVWKNVNSKQINSLCTQWMSSFVNTGHPTWWEQTSIDICKNSFTVRSQDPNFIIRTCKTVPVGLLIPSGDVTSGSVR